MKNEAKHIVTLTTSQLSLLANMMRERIREMEIDTQDAHQRGGEVASAPYSSGLAKNYAIMQAINSSTQAYPPPPPANGERP